MSFLGKIRGMFGNDDQQDVFEEPVRNRTFSATQFREEELARSAEARARTEEARIDAAEVLTPEQRAKLAEHLKERGGHGRW